MTTSVTGERGGLPLSNPENIKPLKCRILLTIARNELDMFFERSYIVNPESSMLNPVLDSKILTEQAKLDLAGKNGQTLLVL